MVYRVKFDSSKSKGTSVHEFKNQPPWILRGLDARNLIIWASDELAPAGSDHALLVGW